jgi:hypothetical protein
MRYTTAFGDTVEVSTGDRVYVDEGDSVGDREFTGSVIETAEDSFRIRTQGGTVTVRPQTVMDVTVEVRS